MRIISEFYDFYDFLSSRSDDRIYARKTEYHKFYNQLNKSIIINNIEINLTPLYDILENFTKSFLHKSEMEFLIVNEKVYVHGYEIYVNYRNIYQSGYIPIHSDKVERNSKKRLSFLNIPYYEINKDFTVNNLNMSYVCEKLNSPLIFIKISSSDIYVTINPTIKNTKFISCFENPYSIFQDIEKFINNKNNPEPKMIQLSDKVKLEKHGFDKYSFRKQPQKKG